MRLPAVTFPSNFLQISHPGWFVFFATQIINRQEFAYKYLIWPPRRNSRYLCMTDGIVRNSLHQMDFIIIKNIVMWCQHSYYTFLWICASGRQWLRFLLVCFYLQVYVCPQRVCVYIGSHICTTDNYTYRAFTQREIIFLNLYIIRHTGYVA